MNDQMLWLRHDVWALWGRASDGERIQLSSSIYREDATGWERLIICGFVLIFEQVWWLTSTRIYTGDTLLSFTLDQAGEINKGSSQRHKAMLVTHWSTGGERQNELMVRTRNVVPGRWASLRCRPKTPSRTSNAMFKCWTHWSLNVQKNTLFFASPQQCMWTR